MQRGRRERKRAPVRWSAWLGFRRRIGSALNATEAEEQHAEWMRLTSATIALNVHAAAAVGAFKLTPAGSPTMSYAAAGQKEVQMHADRHARRQHERLVVRDSSVTQKLLALGWEFLLSGAIWKRGVGYLTRYRLRKITHNHRLDHTST